MSFYQNSSMEPGDSTINQIVEIYDQIVTSLDKGKYICFIFCDISKVFDRVWNQGLFINLRG